MEPKSIPKRFKIEVDFQERNNTLRDRLGTVLEPSWADLGASWGDLGVTFKAVRFGIDSLIDFECQKGAQREAFGEPIWSQNRS